MEPASATAHFAREAADDPENAIEQVYQHLIGADEPLALGDGTEPPQDTRIWTADDWFRLPEDRMLSGFAGDCQPRDEDGSILRTSERLAIVAAARGTAAGAWSAVERDTPDALWIAGPDGGGVTPVARIGEKAEAAAMRDLRGPNGYGRARGTEGVARPNQAARAAALALHVDEIRRASNIELARPAQAGGGSSGRLPEITVRNGAVRAELGKRWIDHWSVPDIADETTAVAIARAVEQDDDPGRSRVAGIIAGHNLVQCAGLRTIGAGHGAAVRAWVEETERRGGSAARTERRKVVALVRSVEWDLRRPRSAREIERAERRAARHAAAEGPRKGTAAPKQPAPAPKRAAGAGGAGGERTREGRGSSR